MSLADNIWWTRRARIITEKRLKSNHNHSQLILIWYSFLSVAISIYYIQFKPDSPYANIIWVIFSVICMTASIFVSGLGYKERAGLVKNCYEKLNSLYLKQMSINANGIDVSDEYNSILGVCENHTSTDFDIAVLEEYIRTTSSQRTLLTEKPGCYTVFCILTFYFKRILLIAFLYLIPIFFIIAASVSFNEQTGFMVL